MIRKGRAKWVNKEDAIAQATFIAELLKMLSGKVLPKFNPKEGPFRPFLDAVVVNYIRSDHRKASRFVPFPEEPDFGR
jgi:hypothetical protein